MTLINWLNAGYALAMIAWCTLVVALAASVIRRRRLARVREAARHELIAQMQALHDFRRWRQEWICAWSELGSWITLSFLVGTITAHLLEHSECFASHLAQATPSIGPQLILQRDLLRLARAGHVAGRGAPS